MTIKEFADKIIRRLEKEELEALREKTRARGHKRERLGSIEQTWISAKWIVRDIFTDTELDK